MSNSVQIGGVASETTTVDVEPSQAFNSPKDDSTRFTTYSPPFAEKKPFFLRWWVIVLIILAIPVGLPIVISLLAVPFALIVALASIVISFAVAGLVSIVAGIASLFAVPIIVFSDFRSAVFVGGMGLMSIGIGIIFLIINTKLVDILYRGLKFLWRKLFKRKDIYKHDYSYDRGTQYDGQQ